MRIATGSTIAVTVLALSAALAGCSDDPEVCTSIDELEQSVQDVSDVDVTADGALDQLTSAIETVQTDLDTVKSDAKAEFADQIETVETAFSALQSSATAAQATPSASALSTVATDLTAFTTSLDTLVTDVKATC